LEIIEKNGVHWQNRGTSTPREMPMNPQKLFCPNIACPARGQAGKGNIHVHSRKTRDVFAKYVDRPLRQRQEQYFIGCAQIRNW
jgi:hypothetical protein